MTHPWDEFSKSLAESVPRRESLRRLGTVLAGTVLAPLGFGAAWARPPADPCKAFCSRCPKKKQAQCLAACQACSGNTSRLCGTCGNYACCASGLACCGGACIDVFDDFYNCGGCGHICDAPGPYEDGACVDGTCLYMCVEGALFCSGACIPVLWDPNNCGACGNVCGGASPYCNQGACAACSPGLVQCGGSCVDLTSDTENCGACGNVCDYPTPSCFSGSCGACPEGSTDCGGYCSDLLDDYNCGACGYSCVPGGFCVSGRCIADA